MITTLFIGLFGEAIGTAAAEAFAAGLVGALVGAIEEIAVGIAGALVEEMKEGLKTTTCTCGDTVFVRGGFTHLGSPSGSLITGTFPKKPGVF